MAILDTVTVTLPTGSVVLLKYSRFPFFYRFSTHFHPYASELIQRLIGAGGDLDKLQSADTLYKQVPNGRYELLDNGKPKPELYDGDFFDVNFHPNRDIVPNTQYNPDPVKDLDFDSGGAYAVYNWELFFHLPLTVAIHLSKNQRFEDAQRWFHYVFDPTDDSDGPAPERFWKVRPFQSTDVKLLEEILINLITGDDPQLKKDTENNIKAWMDAPFRPHLVARYRPQAYMFKTVTAYLDNLIAWGDSLFRQDTGESINEAQGIYVLAANILGPRPQAVPRKTTVRPRTYANLRADLKAFGTVCVQSETVIPFAEAATASASTDADALAALNGLCQSLYFCVPHNEKLLGYWDTVADRLFKIRNSLNIRGIFRQVPLFEPPIDPALLARATAAGLDLGAVVSGLNQPLPLVRFSFLVQKAAEICQEVKALGNGLLAAMEKEDNEALAILRAQHESKILGMTESVRYAQWQEAIKSREGIEKSLFNVVQRYVYYERQLGRPEEEIEIPELSPIDLAALKPRDSQATEIVEPEITPRTIEIDIAEDLEASGGKQISSFEKKELEYFDSSSEWQDKAGLMSTASSASYYVPQFTGDVHFWGVGFTVEYGGQHIGPALQAIAEYFRYRSGMDSFNASLANKLGSYQRREQEWAFQSSAAAGEINQIFKQLRAAQIRGATAEKEFKNHQQQMRHAEAIEHFLTNERNDKDGKQANKALYAWMKRETKGLYAQCFQFAFDIAKKAERALQHELGRPELSYLQFGYLAGKEGLLAGEKLYLDIKRMEMAYHDQNQREYELTKHISLLQVDPLALIQLRTTGRCTVRLPESLFDMDGPGHYFRRIKTVAVSIPCVTGPYASVNCTLTLLKSSIRNAQTLRDGIYAREDAEDDRFSDYFGSLQSIVTSSGQDDTGLFETNLRDERYLPFENSGVVSEWQLELPANPSEDHPRQFDYDTISDVILHLRYTAREGGGLLRKGAVENLKNAIDAAQAAGSVRLFSVRHEFPTEWAKFASQKPGANQRYELSINLRPEHYPFWGQDRLNGVVRVDLLARSADEQTPNNITVADRADKTDAGTLKDTLEKAPSWNDLLVGKLTRVALPPRPTVDLKLYFEDAKLTELWIAVTWSG